MATVKIIIYSSSYIILVTVIFLNNQKFWPFLQELKQTANSSQYVNKNFALLFPSNLTENMYQICILISGFQEGAGKSVLYKRKFFTGE